MFAESNDPRHDNFRLFFVASPGIALPEPFYTKTMPMYLGQDDSFSQQFANLLAQVRQLSSASTVLYLTWKLDSVTYRGRLTPGRVAATAAQHLLHTSSHPISREIW